MKATVKTIVVINVALHVTILLAIISTFYFVYVSHLTANAYDGQISKLVNNITPAINTQDPEIRLALAQVNLERMADYYRVTPTLAHQIQNGWLVAVTVLVLIVLVLGLGGLSVVLGRSYGVELVPIYKELLIENVTTFACVGAIEICFFLFVATKYVPVKPSLMMESTLNDVKQVLSNAQQL